MKKTLLLVLTMVLLMNTLFVSAGATTAAGTDTGITPRWTNTAYVDTSFGVADDIAEAFVDYYCREELFTHAVLKVTIQKRFLLVFWRDVYVWTHTSYEHSMFYFAETPVTEEGMYRAKFYLEFYGNTGAVDVVEHNIEYDYEK